MSERAFETVVTVADELEHLRLVLESAPVSIVILDGGTISSLNAHAERMFGYRREELAGAPFDRLVAGGLRGGKLLTPARDLVALRKDGSSFIAEMAVGAPARGGMSVVTINEISQSRRAETRLRAVIEAAPTAMMLVDQSGRMTLVNARAETLFGYSREELLGQSIEKVLPGRFRQMHVRQRNGYLAAPTARSMGAGRDLYGLRKDGTEVPIEIGLNPVRDGEDEHVLAAIIDITDRKRAEKLRRLSAEFGQRALASAEPGLLAKEAAELIARVTGVGFVRISEIDATGNSLTVITGVGWPAEWLDGHRIAMGPQAQETLRTGEPVFGGVDGPFGLCNEATSQKIVSSASVPIRTKDAIVGVLHVATTERRKWAQDDVSFLLSVGTILGMAIDRERREGRIARLNIELQHRFDESEAFSYSVAHDLRAPLRSVAGFADVLAEEYGATLDEEARRFIKLIVAGANQMGSLIDALLSLSRVSRQEITRGSVDLTMTARSVLADLRGSDPGRVVEVAIAPDMRVTGDAALLRTVVQNLLTNAWKFTRDSNPARIEISSRSIAGEVAYCVKDNGVGFATEFPGDLFAPFKRLHGRDFEGTGIGLATVARIIQRHGGRVWAESQLGAGAEFFFTIGEEPRT